MGGIEQEQGKPLAWFQGTQNSSSFCFGNSLEDILPPILSMSTSATQSNLSPTILETD